jgi:hypothetical protein
MPLLEFFLEGFLCCPSKAFHNVDALEFSNTKYNYQNVVGGLILLFQND